jgi:hypothetical protein
MLYHPCAHPTEVAKLKKLVKGCVGKHVITPSNLVPPERVSFFKLLFLYNLLLCNIYLVKNN